LFDQVSAVDWRRGARRRWIRFFHYRIVPYVVSGFSRTRHGPPKGGHYTI
jgi:hypothetical protein